jgi:hypothetical protein
MNVGHQATGIVGIQLLDLLIQSRTAPLPGQSSIDQSTVLDANGIFSDGYVTLAKNHQS